MHEWTDGYMADIDYTFGYYAELNPSWMRLALLNAGLRPPETATACELGFGQGLSINIHAAASAVRWYGTDFNPAQTGFAREMAATADSGAKLYDDAFAAFVGRGDLPDFDFIGLHGIWSWISAENQAVVVDFIRRKLKVGGVLYISYNTFPGWSAFAPMRHLLAMHFDAMGGSGQGVLPRLDSAMGFCEKLLAVNPAYTAVNPTVVERFKKLQEQNRHYLAHEYFNHNWEPVYFQTMVENLSPAKLDYAGSAYYLDYVDTVNLTESQRAFLKEIPDPLLRESVRDFVINQQFRRDYWVKGARRLHPVEQTELLRAQRVILQVPRTNVPLKIKGALGEASLTEAVYSPILDLMGDNKPKTLGQIEQAVKGAGLSFSQVKEAVTVLVGTSSLLPVQDETAIAKAKKHTDKLNTALINRARFSQDVNVLASPVTGGGFAVNQFQQLYLLALRQGRKQPAEWAQFVWQILSDQGKRIVKQEKTLETDAENIEELTSQATNFGENMLPIIKNLQVA